MIEKVTDNDYILLMNQDRIERTIERMAYQIDEDRQRDWTMLIAGVKERGAAVAECLADILKKKLEHTIYQIHIQEGENELDKVSDTTSFPNYFDYSLVVDDVIFSGQTMLNSLEVVRQKFEINMLRTAVLVDRGHRTVPVEASFCGLELPTKLDEHVQVCLDKNRPNKVVLTTDGRRHID